MFGSRRVRLGAVVVGASLLLAACGSGANSDEESGAGSPGGAGEATTKALSGSIRIDGSSTVAPLTEAIAEEFNADAPKVQVAVGTSGTGGGMKAFCAGEIDIADASRAMKEDEAATCASAGIEFVEFRVGLDGIAVVASAENDFLKCLSLPQLNKMFRSDGTATKWNEVDSSLPAEDIVTFSPGTDSGTFDFFVEKALGDQKDAANPKPISQGSKVTFSEDDNVLVQGVEGEKNGWAYFGLAYFEENADQLHDIAISKEDGGDCVQPTAETVLSGEYPLSRPLYIYVKQDALARSEVHAFVKTYLELAPEVIADVGYVAAPESDYQDGLTRLG